MRNRKSAAVATVAPTARDCDWSVAKKAIATITAAPRKKTLRHESTPSATRTRTRGSMLERWRMVNPDVSALARTRKQMGMANRQSSARRLRRKTPSAAVGSRTYQTHIPG
jgi:hypothetical protein